MYVYYIIEGGNTMFFNNIIYDLCDILLFYYSKIRNCQPGELTYNFLVYHVNKLVDTYKYHDDKIESIVVSFERLDKEDLVLNNLDNTAIYLIKDYIETNLNDTSNRICNYDNFHISLNVCPFEGLTIDSQFIISVCDCMMY